VIRHYRPKNAESHSLKIFSRLFLRIKTNQLNFRFKVANDTKFMVSSVTEGVKVSVKTEYQSDYSSPLQAHYVFTYRITIENASDYTIQLLRRHWTIYDSNGTVREVEGEGVVGLQPVLEPGEVHQYVSGCNLRSSMGKMAGTYLVERIIDGKQVRVAIPEFTMIVPYKLN
jgi:ApaG protein